MLLYDVAFTKTAFFMNLKKIFCKTMFGFLRSVFIWIFDFNQVLIEFNDSIHFLKC